MEEGTIVILVLLEGEGATELEVEAKVVATDEVEGPGC